MKLKNKLRKIIDIEKTLNKYQESFLYNYRANYLSNQAMRCKDMGISDRKYSDYEIIVSLTTHGKRIRQVYLAIESIMQGTVKPNRIVLCVSNEYQEDDLPVLLKLQQERGLEILYCKDIRSYTKLLPTMKKYPDAAIITIDDDILYNMDFVENLIREHQRHPDCICANRVHRVKLNKEFKPLPYFEWEWESKEIGESSLNFQTGVGGVLYPPNCFNKEVFNDEVFLEICKYADDVWFYAMALMSGRKIRKTSTIAPNGKDYIENPEVQDCGLFNVNLNDGNFSNDTQLKAVFDKYNLYGKLRIA